MPGDLGALVGFVARYLDAFGESLQPDDLVLSGSYTARALALHPGEEPVADFGRPGRVSVHCRTATDGC